MKTKTTIDAEIMTCGPFAPREPTDDELREAGLVRVDSLPTDAHMLRIQLEDAEAKVQKIAVTLENERACIAAQHRELERWRHGQQVEGDYVCPDSLRVTELERELAQEKALRESAETAMEQAQTDHDWQAGIVQKLERERDEARAECALANRAQDAMYELSEGLRAEVERLRGQIPTGDIQAMVTAWLAVCQVVPDGDDEGTCRRDEVVNYVKDLQAECERLQKQEKYARVRWSEWQARAERLDAMRPVVEAVEAFSDGASLQVLRDAVDTYRAQRDDIPEPLCHYNEAPHPPPSGNAPERVWCWPGGYDEKFRRAWGVKVGGEWSTGKQVALKDSEQAQYLHLDVHKRIVQQEKEAAADSVCGLITYNGTNVWVAGIEFKTSMAPMAVHSGLNAARDKVHAAVMGES